MTNTSEGQQPEEERTELRVLVETYYDVQAMRIEAQNRVRDAVQKRGMDPDRAKALQAWVDEPLARQEAQLKAAVLRLIRDRAIWRTWLKRVRGVGPCICGGLLAWAGDLSRFDTPSKLWAYCGLHTVNGRAPRREAGQKANWNPRLRVLAWKAANSFVTVGRGYRDVYLREKERLRLAHPEAAEYDPPRKTRDGRPWLRWTDGHIHAMALRKTSKLFLAHYWEVGRRLQGLPVRLPYVVEVLGHTGVIPVITE